MAGVLFEDIFNVKDIDPEGKKFDRGGYCFYRNSTIIIYSYLHVVWLQLSRPKVSAESAALWESALQAMHS
ncbi:uncharacterized protein GBIM_07913 [Gryllus bimaculatus]|nr:uncharacterized protein GBIM_07913 [Gryllus bimaculatus]